VKKLDDFKKASEKMTSYLGESSSTTVDEIFAIIHNFCCAFRKAIKDNIREKEMEERRKQVEEKRRLREEQKQKQAKVTLNDLGDSIGDKHPFFSYKCNLSVLKNTQVVFVATEGVFDLQ
jgi:hypothetical protein